MKKTEKTIRQITKHREVITIKHKGIGVTVDINYEKGIVSLVDTNQSVKKWVFAQRTLEYMQGWLNIMEAMQEAVRYAKIMLENRLAENSRFREEIIKEAMKLK